ncbi:MAG: ATP-binding protein [Ktedonobacterales bacterium]
MSADRISPLFGASFGTLLRRYREAANLTQEALAQRAGLSVRGISDLERGVRQRPRRDTVGLLADALGLPPHRRVLLEAAARPAEGGGLPPQRDRPPHNLPLSLTPLVGRERDARLAAEALDRRGVRLLTLTGPGGVGKTQLALHVAEDVLDSFADGAHLVTLAALRDPALVLAAIAAASGLRATPERLLDEQLGEFLRDREMLLLLDNFEHLMDAALPVAELLAACPRLKVHATIREPLNVAREQEMAVAPLDDEAAVELFLARARAARPSFDPVGDEQATVAAICRQVDRLPLGIELAAGWVRVLSLPALLEHMDGGDLRLLSGGRRDAVERQRTLRDTIAWSERLLDPAERQLFQRLAVFAGGWTLEAAEAICAGASADSRDAVEGQPVLEALARLVEKSLVRAETLERETRFSLLETIHEYARERLDASGEADELGRRHAEYFATVAAELGWIGNDQDARDRRLERELPNERAALVWSLEHREPEIGLRLATPLGRWWYSRGAFAEGEGWLRALLALDAAAGERGAPAALRVSALYALILFALDRRHYDEAEAMAREGLALARRTGDAARAGNMLAELGHVAEARGELDAAMAYFEEGLAQYEHGGEGAAIGRTLSSLGNLARTKGDYERASGFLERALAWARERDFSFAIASALVSLGHVAVEQGDDARALALYYESLGLYQTLRNRASLAWCMEGITVAVGVHGTPDSVARLCGIVAGLRQAAAAATVEEWRPFARASEVARQALGEQRFATAYAEGAALPVAQALSYALAITGEATSHHT